MDTKSKETCLRIRLEGKNPEQIQRCADKLNLVIKKIYEKKDKRSGYSYYGYGNTIDPFKE